MHTVELLMTERFRSGDPRSAEYKAGVRAVLELKIAGKPIERPYAMGTAQCDAFYAGHDDSLRIWRAAQDEAAQ